MQHWEFSPRNHMALLAAVMMWVGCRGRVVRGERRPPQTSAGSIVQLQQGATCLHATGNRNKHCGVICPTTHVWICHKVMVITGRTFCFQRATCERCRAFWLQQIKLCKWIMKREAVFACCLRRLRWAKCSVGGPSEAVSSLAEQHVSY